MAVAERYVFRAWLSWRIDRRVDHSRPGFVDFARLVMCCCLHRLGVCGEYGCSFWAVFFLKEYLFSFCGFCFCFGWSRTAASLSCVPVTVCECEIRRNRDVLFVWLILLTFNVCFWQV